jgi:hypothetical protein
MIQVVHSPRSVKHRASMVNTSSLPSPSMGTAVTGRAGQEEEVMGSLQGPARHRTSPPGVSLEGEMDPPNQLLLHPGSPCHCYLN